MANRNPISSPARLLALVAALLATACGGDSGGGGAGPAPLDAPTAPVTITAANGPQVAASALQMAISGPSLALPTGVVTVAGARSSGLLSRTAQDVQGRLSRASTAFTTGAVQTEPCMVSGSVIVSDTPTSMSITFDQCSDYEGEVTNGSMSLTGLSQTGDEWTGSTSATYNIDVTMTSPGATLRTVGGMTIETSWTPTSSSSHVSGGYLGVSDGVTTEVVSGFSVWESLDETTGLATSSSSFTLASSALDGVVTVSTPTPFRTYSFYAPHEGVLVVTGAGGGEVRLTVLGDDAAPSPQVLVEIDANGDGSYETPLYHDWFELTGA